MYLPGSFREEDPEKLRRFIQENSFGVLISKKESIQASHLPFLFESSKDGLGYLLGHMAKANNQWENLAGQEVMVLFDGPHAYISPTWYEEKETVPTWNYVAVHIYGKYVEVADEPEWTSIMDKMVRFYEQDAKNPWDLKSLSGDFYEKLKQMTRAFKVEITRIEGKWKLSQNHSIGRREKVIRHLEQGDFNAKAVAELMKEGLRP